MRLKLLILVVIGYMSILSAQTDSTKPKEGGFLEFKDAALDLGTISGDSIVNAKFTLYNTGTEPVALLRIFSDCNCTVPSYTNDLIEPGDSTQLEVKYDPRGYRWGQFHRTLRIRSTAVNSHLTVTLKGSIARKYKR